MRRDNSTHRLRPKRPLIILGFGLALLLLPSAASAIVVGPCSGSVTIDGITYGPDNDTAANPIVIPNKPDLVAEWAGETTQGPITKHTGDIGIVIGPATVIIEDWGGDNAENEEMSNGQYAIDDAKAALPTDLVGLYEVAAKHVGEGGSCDGRVIVFIEGNPLTTPLGAGASVGTLLALGAVVVAGRGRAA